MRAGGGMNQKTFENLQKEGVSKYSLNDFHRLLTLP